MMETLLAPLAEITAYRNAEEAIQKQQFPLHRDASNHKSANGSMGLPVSLRNGK